MINVQEITSRLAMMPDQQLTQYATMNRTDPYILSLAMSEHNRRKQMRTAAQGAMMGQTPPPPVVDQLLQQMDADSVVQPRGIAALSADVDVADGGIAGYAEGGEVGAPAESRSWWGDMLRMASPVPSEAPGLSGGSSERAARNTELIRSAEERERLEEAERRDRIAALAAELSGSSPSADTALTVPPYTERTQPATPTEDTPDTSSGGRSSVESRSVQPFTVGLPDTNFSRVEAPDVEGRISGMTADYLDAFKQSQDQLRAEWEAGRPPPESFAERLALFQESKDTPDARRRIRGLAQLEAAAAIMQPDQHWMQAAINGLVTMGRSESEALEELEAAEFERRKSLAEVHEAVRAAERGYWQESAQFAESAFERMQSVYGTVFGAQVNAVGRQAELDMGAQEANLRTDISRAEMQQRASQFNAQQQQRASEATFERQAGQEDRLLQQLVRQWDAQVARRVNEIVDNQMQRLDVARALGKQPTALTEADIRGYVMSEMQQSHGGSRAWDVYMNLVGPGGTSLGSDIPNYSGFSLVNPE